MNTAHPLIPARQIDKLFLVINSVMALTYFSWWFLLDHIGNPVLYALLFFGEVYHVGMALMFWHTLWPGKRLPQFGEQEQQPTVDVFIPVAGEPASVIRQTVAAAKHMKYDNHRVFILNDGLVAGKENWREAEQVAAELGVACFTRTQPGGAKAGNINHALRQTTGEIIVLFDADMAPRADFLLKVLPYFTDKRTGFLQTPQYYKNAEVNDISRTAWDQQRLFFGPIMIGKDRTNSAFICGTNVAIRRAALTEVGGMYEKSIAEDFLTSLFIHQKGWQSYYLPEVLAEGLGPEDLQSYYKQQLRWARGSLQVLFGSNPLFKRHLTWGQRIQYLSSGLYWFNGVIVLIDALMPLIFLFTGVQPVAATTTSFAIFFIPFIFLTLLTLYLASNGTVSFLSFSFAQSSFLLELQALVSVMLRQNMGFAVTSKRALSGNFFSLAVVHAMYCIMAFVAAGVGIAREGLNPSVMTNIAWAWFNVVLFVPYIYISLKGNAESREEASFDAAFTSI